MKECKMFKSFQFKKIKTQIQCVENFLKIRIQFCKKNVFKCMCVFLVSEKFNRKKQLHK